MIKRNVKRIINCIMTLLLLFTGSCGVLSEPVTASAGGPMGYVGSLAVTLSAGDDVTYDIPIGYNLFGQDLGTTFFSVCGTSDDTLAVISGDYTDGMSINSRAQIAFSETLSGKERKGVEGMSSAGFYGDSNVRIRVYRGSVKVSFECANVFEPIERVQYDYIRLSMYTDSVIFGNELVVSGETDPEAVVELIVEGQQLGSTKADKAGNYRFAVPVSFEEDLKCFRVMVRRADYRYIFRYADVIYAVYTPEITDFFMTYFFDSEKTISVEFDLLGNNPCIFQQSPEGSFEFYVRFDAPEYIAGVKIVDPDDTSKYIRAMYDEATGMYKASGVFDAADPSYCPRFPTLEYTLNAEDEYMKKAIIARIISDISSKTSEDPEMPLSLKKNVSEEGTDYSFDISPDLYDVLCFEYGEAKAEMCRDLHIREDAENKMLSFVLEEKDIVIDMIGDIGDCTAIDVLSNLNDLINIVYEASSTGDTESVTFKLDLVNAAADTLKLVVHTAGKTGADALFEGLGLGLSLAGDITEGGEKGTVDFALDSLLVFKPSGEIIAEAKLEAGFIMTVLEKCADLFLNGFDLAEKFASGQFIDHIYARDLLQSHPSNRYGKKSECCVNSYYDPSGCVYEFSHDDRLEGVTASAWYIPFDAADEHFWDAPDESEAELWDASEYGQVNPQPTDNLGNYFWMVPKGWWQIRFHKDGYADTVTEWMEVPPERFNVDVAMTSLSAPRLLSAEDTENGVLITFSEYMDVASINDDNCILQVNGTRIKECTFTPVFPVYSEEYGMQGARAFLIGFEKTESGTASVSAENCIGYNGLALTPSEIELNVSGYKKTTGHINGLHWFFAKLKAFFLRLFGLYANLL